MARVIAEWGELFASLTLFLISHAIPAQPQVRTRLIRLMGRPLYLIGYSCLSIVILAWLIAAATSAPFVELWPREEWQAVVPAVGMATILVTFGLTSPNPLSLSAHRGKSFDPRHPGVVGFVRHPVLSATLLWSVTHLVPNGDLAHVIMFGLFALLSVVGMAMLDRRKRRSLGINNWHELAKMTSNWPLGSVSKGWLPSFGLRSALRLACGVIIYAILVASHGTLTGIPLS